MNNDLYYDRWSNVMSPVAPEGYAGEPTPAPVPCTVYTSGFLFEANPTTRRITVSIETGEEVSFDLSTFEALADLLIETAGNA